MLPNIHILNYTQVIFGAVYLIASVFWIVFFVQDNCMQKRSIETRIKSQTISGGNRYLDVNDEGILRSYRIKIVRNYFCIAIAALDVIGIALLAVKAEIINMTRHHDGNKTLNKDLKNFLRYSTITFIEPAFIVSLLLAPQLAAMLSYYLSRAYNGAERVEMRAIWRLAIFCAISSIVVFITKANPLFEPVHYPALLVLTTITVAVNCHYFRRLSLALKWRYNDSALHLRLNTHKRHERELVQFRTAAKFYFIGQLLVLVLILNHTIKNIFDNILIDQNIITRVDSYFQFANDLLNNIVFLYLSSLYLRGIYVYVKSRAFSGKKHDATRENIKPLLEKYHKLHYFHK